MPEAGLSAIWAIIEVLNRLKRVKLAFGTSPGGKALKLFSPPTLNVGVIAGGVAPNMVPARCEVQLDFRYLPGSTFEDVLVVLRREAAEVKKSMPGVEFEFAMVADQPSTLISPDHPLASVIQKHTEAVTGNRPKIIGSSGATVTKPFVLRGTPAVAFTCGDEWAEHKANESIEITELTDFATVMTRVLWDLIGPDGKPIGA